MSLAYEPSPLTPHPHPRLSALHGVPTPSISTVPSGRLELIGFTGIYGFSFPNTFTVTFSSFIILMDSPRSCHYLIGIVILKKLWLHPEEVVTI